jgi:membrane fusion protein (multidrug efflux system)
VAQQVAADLREGELVEVFAGASAPITAKIVALDARIDPATRNAIVRARIDGAGHAPSPGSSVRVRVPVGAAQKAVAVPVSALRKGPQGDQVFVITQDKDGRTRAHAQQVESGAMFGDEVVIHTGLTAGERVAASGSFKLREAALVSISDAGPGESERRQAVSLN